MGKNCDENCVNSECLPMADQRKSQKMVAIKSENYTFGNKLSKKK